MVRVIFHGGHNYAPDMEPEEFPSIADAAAEWRNRRDYGYWSYGSNGYLHPLWGEGVTEADPVIWDVGTDTAYTAELVPAAYA